jgi:SAM-dependent methyltransferase
MIGNKLSSKTENEIQNIMSWIDISKKSVLELGCGNGRISFAIAEKVRELVAIDINSKAIREAKKKNKYTNVTFLVENIENFDLGRAFDIILSIGVGYMYLKDIPRAMENVSNHLKINGVFLLVCSSPETEYQKIVDLLVEENVRTVAFYAEFEKILLEYFTIEKTSLKNQLDFTNFEQIMKCFERELREEYQTEMSKDNEKELSEYFKHKDTLSICDDSQVYLCKK